VSVNGARPCEDIGGTSRALRLRKSAVLVLVAGGSSQPATEVELYAWELQESVYRLREDASACAPRFRPIGSARRRLARRSCVLPPHGFAVSCPGPGRKSGASLQRRFFLPS
jgi:hypothetical protein